MRSTLFALGAWLVSCSSSTPPPAAPEPAPAPAAESESPAGATSSEALALEEGTDFCVRLHEQVLPCSEAFIDLIMDLRAQYDPNFAAMMADANTKAEARKTGLEELAADGAGPLEPRRERCRGYASHGPPTPRSAVPRVEACYAMAACAEKVECLRPVMEERFQGFQRAKAGP